MLSNGYSKLYATYMMLSRPSFYPYFGQEIYQKNMDRGQLLQDVVKVRKSRKQIVMSSILPKNKQKDLPASAAGGNSHYIISVLKVDII